MARNTRRVLKSATTPTPTPVPMAPSLPTEMALQRVQEAARCISRGGKRLRPVTDRSCNDGSGRPQRGRCRLSLRTTSGLLADCQLTIALRDKQSSIPRVIRCSVSSRPSIISRLTAAAPRVRREAGCFFGDDSERRHGNRDSQEPAAQQPLAIATVALDFGDVDTRGAPATPFFAIR